MFELKNQINKAEGGKEINVFAKLFYLSVGKERKGFYFFYLYTVLLCRGTRERFNALQRIRT